MSEVFSKNILSQWQNKMFKRSLQLRSLTQNALMKINPSEMIQRACTIKHHGSVIYGKWTDFVVSLVSFILSSQGL